MDPTTFTNGGGNGELDLAGEAIEPETGGVEEEEDFHSGLPMRGPEAAGLLDENSLMTDPRFSSLMKKLETEGIPAMREKPRLPSTPRAGTEELPPVISYGFSKLVFDFLEALRIRFPKRKMVLKAYQHYWSLIERMPQMPYQRFKELVDLCGEDVFKERTPENEQIVVQHLLRSPIFRIVKIHELWRPELDENTKATMWEYVKRLVQVTNLISSFDSELCAMINGISMDSLVSVQKGGRQSIDINLLLEELETRITSDERFMEKLVDIAMKQ